MTKYLSTVLGENEQQFARRIEKLEKTTLQTGIDVQLTSEIRYELARKLRELGLDPSDTTTEELTRALFIKAEQAEQHVRSYIGAGSITSSVDILQKVSKKFTGYAKKQNVWAIKRVTLKKIFAELPPTKTMKVLKYRSLPSLLKRESVTELYALAHLIESDTYKSKLAQRLKKLENKDFEELPLELICVNKARWHAIALHCKLHTAPVILHKEVAAMLVLPVEIHNTKCLALLTSALLVKKIQECKVNAAYVKIKSLDPIFYQHVHATFVAENIPLFNIQNDQIMWSHAFRVHSKAQTVPEHYGPHVTEEDLSWFHIEDAFLHIHESFSFWLGTHTLAFVSKSGEVVSLHMLDVAFSCMYHQPDGRASVMFVRQIIADELLERYLDLPPFNKLLQEFTYKLTDTQGNVVYA
jgi:hypothetical protein